MLGQMYNIDGLVCKTKLSQGLLVSHGVNPLVQPHMKFTLENLFKVIQCMFLQRIQVHKNSFCLAICGSRVTIGGNCMYNTRLKGIRVALSLVLVDDSLGIQGTLVCKNSSGYMGLG